jgi:hypothetical protein
MLNLILGLLLETGERRSVLQCQATSMSRRVLSSRQVGCLGRPCPEELPSPPKNASRLPGSRSICRSSRAGHVRWILDRRLSLTLFVSLDPGQASLPGRLPPARERPQYRPRSRRPSTRGTFICPPVPSSCARLPSMAISKIVSIANHSRARSHPPPCLLRWVMPGQACLDGWMTAVSWTFLEGGDVLNEAGFRLPGGQRRVPHWAVVCDPHRLRKPIPNGLSDGQLRHLVPSRQWVLDLRGSCTCMQ